MEFNEIGHSASAKAYLEKLVIGKLEVLTAAAWSLRARAGFCLLLCALEPHYERTSATIPQGADEAKTPAPAVPPAPKPLVTSSSSSSWLVPAVVLAAAVVLGFYLVRAKPQTSS